MVTPSRLIRFGASAEVLAFEALELELTAVLDTGRILEAKATKHPFIAEAFARMETDQFADDATVVFATSHLSRCSDFALRRAWSRSATSWRG